VSAAAFFIAAVACLKGSELVMKRVGINPTRTGFIEIMRHFGATIEFAHIDEGGPEPYADLRVTGGRLSPEPQSVSGGLIPALIDEIPILAVVGTQLDGGLEVRDAAELRIKESDRIAVLCRNLSRMGARIDERSDGFRVSRSHLRGAKIDPEGDHRIAMALAIAGLLAEGETEIVGAECCEVSFPGFFEELNSAVVPEI
jgi:3-phosphoshikimate 1-carboxyvinyltransferase